MPEEVLIALALALPPVTAVSQADVDIGIQQAVGYANTVRNVALSLGLCFSEETVLLVAAPPEVAGILATFQFLLRNNVKILAHYLREDGNDVIQVAARDIYLALAIITQSNGTGFPKCFTCQDVSCNVGPPCHKAPVKDCNFQYPCCITKCSKKDCGGKKSKKQ